MTREAAVLEAPLRQKIYDRVVGLVERGGGLLGGHVPLDLIDHRDVPVNTQNLAIISHELEDEAEQKGSDGQIQPVMLGLVDITSIWM